LGIDRKAVAGVCGEDKLASPHTEQVVNSHQLVVIFSA